jgi:hypothetical protein
MAPNAALEVPPDRKHPQHGVKVSSQSMISLDDDAPSHGIFAVRITHHFASLNCANYYLTTTIQGVYYGGHWLDIEDCTNTFNPDPSTCSSCPTQSTCPRSKSRNASTSPTTIYDVVIIGAGCIGSAIARELSRYQLKTLLLEAADDVSQGATKGNSGIVHAGYDDTPGTNRAKYCWKGNQMFPSLDRELRFGYQLNGSLVVATSDSEVKILHELLERGKINGVQNLRIVQKEELFAIEPALNPNAIAGLYAPDAGNVIPYEYAIALAENAVDNGVELRIRREVVDIVKDDECYIVKVGDKFIARDGELFSLSVRHWEPLGYVEARERMGKSVSGEDGEDGGIGEGRKRLLFRVGIAISSAIVMMKGMVMMLDDGASDEVRIKASLATLLVCAASAYLLLKPVSSTSDKTRSKKPVVLKDLVDKCPPLEGKGDEGKVQVADMFTGGSGSWNAVKGVTVGRETVKCRYVINCAGSASDKIAKMIGDESFYIKPRLGDYLLLNRNQVCLISRSYMINLESNLNNLTQICTCRVT